MPTSSKLETVRRRLLQRGAPREYIDRLIGELVDHRDDAIRELIEGGAAADVAEREADAGMGEPDALVGAAMTTLRRRSFAGRHPAITLLVVPVILFVICTAVTLLIAALVAGLLSPSFRAGSTSALGRSVLSAACWICMYVLPAALTAMCFVIARRGQRRGWGWAAASVIAALASIIFVAVFLDAGGTTGRLVMGASPIPSAARMLPPLCVAVLLEFLTRRRIARGLA